MTRQENLIYRKQCPYDAMGDYSVLMENEKNIKTERNAKSYTAKVKNGTYKSESNRFSSSPPAF
jgi:hypothetical protein